MWLTSYNLNQVPTNRMITHDAGFAMLLAGHGSTGSRPRRCHNLLLSILTALMSPLLQGAAAPKHFWEVWQLFNLGDPQGILWTALPRQLPTVLALAFVVAFGEHIAAAIPYRAPGMSARHSLCC